eukprot:SAG31_NODE_7411_length_1696_cov_1.681277_2_plen_161_part_01
MKKNAVANAQQVAGANATAKLLQAEALKNRGNAAFKSGTHAEAEELYSKALKKLGSHDSDSGSKTAIIVACLLNRAAVRLKTDDPDGAAEDCTAVLDLEPCNAKALYRRAQAFVAIGMNSEATRDLHLARDLRPDDKAVAALLQAVIPPGPQSHEGSLRPS